MAQTIKIKRSSTTTAPSSLASGELAYSTKTGVQKLYYGDGTDVLAIGGKSYTDKLDGIESGATADQTNAEIRAAVEAATDSNVFTDADHTKLSGIEALADVTDATNVAAAGALMLTGGTLTSDLVLGDNVKAKFGNSSDLQIYHDGSASYISEVGNGNLKIMGSNLEMKSTSDEMYLDATQDGTLRLYCDNQVRLTTTGTGVTVSGDLKINNTTVENSLETGHIYAPEVLVIDPASHSANTGKVVIDGDLEVKGVTTTIESTTIDLGDTLINLNSNQDENSAPPTSLTAGLTIDRGNATYDAHIMWRESNSTWRVSSGGNYDYELLHVGNFESAVTSLDGGTF